MFTQENFLVVSLILAIAGALNWLGVGVMNVNYVALLTGNFASYIYIAVGVAGIYLAYVMGMETYKKSLKA